VKRSYSLVAGLVLLPGFWGCAPLPPGGRPALSEPVRGRVYERAQVEFARARLIKPRVAVPAPSREFTFAPLILEEIEGTKPAGERGCFGVESSDRTNSTICFRLEQTFVSGRPHDQLTYVWTCANPRHPPSEGAPPPVQGVCITLDSAGRPAIWEVWADSSGARILFVAQSLEAAAAAEFGKPRPGRRFSVERDLDDTPNSVVARVIEDGPEPMGPMLYLGAGTRDIVTITCRCMPVQAGQLIEEQGYDLVELKAGDAGRGLDPAGRVATPARLEEHLRLPDDF
jgi:hypothetical protein